MRTNPLPIPPGNINSNNTALAHFTNPTELAFRKGVIKTRWPLVINGYPYSDLEQAYQLMKTSSIESNEDLMIYLMYEKLKQYYGLYSQIRISGGKNWIERCSHRLYGRSLWEGDGLKSKFIFCLYVAYTILEEEREWVHNTYTGNDVPF